MWLLNNDGSNYFSKLKKKKEKITRSLLEYVNSIDSKISIWGCGAKTLSILSSIDSSFLDKVKFVIDSDVNKHNLYIPCSSIQVVSDKDAVQLGVGIIMVLALSHSTEIYKQIRVSFPANTIVVSIDSNGDIFDMDTC